MSAEAEKAILGSILLDNRTFDAISGLRAEDLSLDAHRVIFQTIKKLLTGGDAADIITLQQELTSAGMLSSIGGLGYLFSLTENLPRHLAMESYVEIVRDESALRRLRKIGEEIALRAASGSETASDITEASRIAIESILSDFVQEKTDVASFTPEILNTWMRNRHSEENFTLAYGIQTLDKHTGGMYPGENTTIGGDPGHGKTSFALQAITANCPAGHGIFFVSLEMTRAQVLKRLWANEAHVENFKLRRPKLANIMDEQAVVNAAGKVAEWPLHIYDKSTVRLADLTAMLRYSIRKYKVRLFIVDFAQIVASTGRDFREQVSRASTELTAIAKGEGVHLMLLSQMSRKSHAEWNRPPRMSDLRESGALEQNAHCIVLIHRPWDEENGRIHSRAAAYDQPGCELIVAKQREGATFAFPVQFNEKTLQFEG